MDFEPEAPPPFDFVPLNKDLNLSEITLIAGLPAAPSRYSPFGSRPEAAKNRQETVLRRMTEDGAKTKEANSLKTYRKHRGGKSPKYNKDTDG